MLGDRHMLMQEVLNSNQICLYSVGEIDCHINAIANIDEDSRLPLGLQKRRDSCSAGKDMMLSFNCSTCNCSTMFFTRSSSDIFSTVESKNLFWS